MGAGGRMDFIFVLQRFGIQGASFIIKFQLVPRIQVTTGLQLELMRKEIVAKNSIQRA